MDFNQLIEDWPLIVTGANHLVAFLEQERIPDAARLPTEVVLAPLVALTVIAVPGLWMLVSPPSDACSVDAASPLAEPHGSRRVGERDRGAAVAGRARLRARCR